MIEEVPEEEIIEALAVPSPVKLGGLKMLS
jgi:hypothetical protein